MHRAIRAITGGVAGMGVMSLVLLLAEVEARFVLGVPAAIARFVGMPGQLALGYVVFAGAGILVWPLLFVSVEEYLATVPGGEDPAVEGMVLATVLWVAFVVLGSGGLSGLRFALYLAFTLIAHLAYGFTLGAVYARLGRPTEEADSRTPA